MKQSRSISDRSQDVLAIALKRSLENLGIEIKRFNSLSLEQRKLAICEAIYKTINSVADDFNWITDRSKFQKKKLCDFSPDQIKTHQSVVDALIALVCLGETLMVRPLVSYMLFPEPRWSILIDSVLRALSKKTIYYELYKIPNKSEILNWQKWAFNPSFQTEIEDFYKQLYSILGKQQFNVKNYRTCEYTDSSWLMLRNDYIKMKWRCFSEEQAKFCDSKLFPELSSHNFSKFIIYLDEYIVNNQFERNYDTLIACIKDEIYNTEIYEQKILEFLFKKFKKEVNPKTFEILFQILKSPKKNRKLANEFAKKIAGPDLKKYFLIVISDILTNSTSENAIDRIVKTYIHLDKKTQKNRIILNEFIPSVVRTIINSLHNKFFNEIESIIIFESIDPSEKKSLFQLMDEQFKKNNIFLLKLIDLNNSPDTRWQFLSKQTRLIYNKRREINKFILDADKIDYFSIFSIYKDMFNKWFDGLKEIEKNYLIDKK